MLLLLIVIILTSFFLYSSNYYALLNSDDAVSILMLHDFHWPEDLYFWNQDRYGSLIPLLGQVPLKLFHLSAITSESIVHYLILIAGYFGFAGLFRTHFAKILFAIVWFLPPMRMIDLLRYNIGIEYSLMGIAVYFIDRLYVSSGPYSSFRRYVYLIITVLVLTAAVWVSELAVPSIAVMLGVLLFYYFRKEGNSFASLIKHREADMLIIACAAAFTVLFILYAKQHAVKVPEFTSFNNAGEFLQTVNIFLKSIVDFFVFQANEPVTSIYAWLSLITVVVFIIYRRKVNANNEKRIWLSFFIAECIIVLALILISNWTLLNGVPRRYFIPTYVSLWIVFLLIADSAFKSEMQLFKGLLIITAVTGAISTPYNIKFIWPGTLTPRAELSSEFKKLGNIGIISEYWNSYVVSCIDPESIVATPHEHAGYRNKRFTEEVFNQEKIYIIKDMWFKDYPDTLIQFGRTLVKEGKEFVVGDSYVCRYKTFIN